MLARLAQAASRTRNARSVMPSSAFLIGSVVPTRHLLGVDSRNPIVRPEEVIGTVKVRRRNTNDGKGMLIEKNNLAEDVWTCGKMTLPEVVAENNVWRRCEAMFIRSMKEATESGLQAEHIEVVSGCGIAPALKYRLVDFYADVN